MCGSLVWTSVHGVCTWVVGAGDTRCSGAEKGVDRLARGETRRVPTDGHVYLFSGFPLSPDPTEQATGWTTRCG